jgi:hypothetical protein
MTRLIRLGDRPFGWIAFFAMATGAIVVAIGLGALTLTLLSILRIFL